MAANNKPALEMTDTEAFASVKASEVFADSSLPETEVDELQATVDALYAFWVNGNKALLNKALAAEFVDRTLPPDRPQGPEGTLAASKAFRTAIPDMRINVVFRMVTAHRVVSQLQFTGHFSGEFQGTKGTGQAIDFISIEVLQIAGGKIVEIRHQEDDLTFMKQIGLVG